MTEIKDAHASGTATKAHVVPAIGHFLTWIETDSDLHDALFTKPKGNFTFDPLSLDAAQVLREKLYVPFKKRHLQVADDQQLVIANDAAAMAVERHEQAGTATTGTVFWFDHRSADWSHSARRDNG